jgi:predicted ATP-binding protein involved in virulence
LPLLAYYGTGRLWRQGRLGREVRRAVAPLVATRTLGYRDCLDPSSNFREFTYWFRQLSLALLQRQTDPTVAGSAPEDTDKLTKMLEWIGEAVAQVLHPSGWKHVFYDLAAETISAIHPEHGALPVAQLSDGVRNLLAMVADIAFRCCKLNPHLGPKGSHGLVLIDEVDMHLHPAWQQRVLLALLEAFPRVQFVVTTHSPHVVSTVPRESVRVLTESGGQEPTSQTHGRDSAAVLAEVFGVAPEPPLPIVENLRRYRALAEQGHAHGEEARNLRRRLEEELGPEDPRLAEIDTLLALRERLGIGD